MEEHWTDLREVARRDDIWYIIHIGSADGINDAEDSLTEIESSQLKFNGAAKTVELIAKRLVEIVDREIYRDVVEQLAAEGEVSKRKLAFLYSCKDKASGFCGNRRRLTIHIKCQF